MKTIILYATKYGATAEVARLIAEKFDDALIHDLKQADVPTIDDFDCVIIGSAVYAGSFRNEAKTYINKNTEALCNKRLGLFVCGMSPDESGAAIKANVPDKVLEASIAVCSTGGMFDPEKANFFERLIMKLITKQSGVVNTINNENITEFTNAMKDR